MLIFDWIIGTIRMQDFGQVWVIHPILELKVESTPLEAHGLKVGKLGYSYQKKDKKMTDSKIIDVHSMNAFK